MNRIYRFFAQSIRNRLLAVLLLVALPALLGGAVYSLSVSRHLAVVHTVASQQNQTALLAQGIGDFLGGARADTLFLSRLQGLAELRGAELTEEAAYAVALQRAAQEFLTFAQVKGIYYRVRLVNGAGQEVARVDTDGANYFVVPPDQLQNLAGWYYFDTALDSPVGEVTVSPLELNIVQGEVERPLRPVIRYAAPIRQGQTASDVVILEILADHFLADLGARAAEGEIIALVDQDGYYLYHSAAADKVWGRDLRTGVTVFQDYPQVLEAIFQAPASQSSGSLQTRQDFISFQRVSLPGTPAYSWVLLSIRPYRQVMAPVLRFEGVLILSVLLTLGGVAGIGLRSNVGLARPLQELAQQAARMGRGDLDAPIGVGFGARPRQDEIGRLAQALDQARANLRAAHQDLAAQIQQLDRRATRSQRAAEVARAAGAILDPQRLLKDGVNFIHTRLGFYHTGIFLLDETREWLVLQSASSEGGQRLLGRGYRLRIDQAGVVGQAAATGTAQLARPGEETSWLPARADLPDTRAEMALPLKFQARVIGVLDVHAAEAEAFTPDDMVILQTLADQLVLLWHNAQLFKEAQARYDTVLQTQGEYGRQAWAELSRTLVGGGYRYYRQTLSQAGDFWQPEMTSALQRGETTLAEATPEAVALPLRARDQIIGVVAARKPDGTLWTAEELALLETVRGRLEVALESARFYRDSQRSAAREQLLREITEQIRNAVDVESVMRTAVSEIGRTLNREVFVYLEELGEPDGPAAVATAEISDAG